MVLDVDERPVKVHEVAFMCKVGVDTVRRWLRTGKMRGRRIGGQTGYLVSLSEVRRFLAEASPRA